MNVMDNGASEKSRAAMLSLLAALGLTSIKLAVGLYTNSLGILSEALHSGLDLLAAVLTLAAVRISAKPADSRHPYGHGKAENLSALAQTVLLFATCAWVVYEGVQRLASGSSPVVPSLWGVGVMAISMTVDINRVRVLRRVAKNFNSQALEADALHFSTDILSSAVVLVGVLAVWLAQALQLPAPISRVLSQADTVAALLVAAIIFRASMHMASDAVNMLMDSASSQASEAIVGAVRKIAGISEVRRVRVRTSGPQSFVDLTVGVAPGLKVSDGHRLAHEAEEAVAGVLPGADVTVHVEPRKSCRIDENNPFALVQVAASEHGLAVHDVHILSADSACHIELHVELPGQMPFDRAYARVKAFEDTLREALPGVEIVSHMEPKAPSAALEPGASVSVPFSEMAWREIKAAVENEPLAAMPHKFSTYVLPEQGVCISFHCNVSVGLSVEEAHNVCTRLEKRIRAAVPQLGRLSIHMEPAVVSNTPAA
ncbi:cation diffusion facilitator family transporter [uncultured Desulfovibrio sp.]|uniref:cation diffusion facilitator family transporter n=1 Tax=Desulfovibrio sp. TaxID=885 RepID=UPI00260E1AFA|nr:cation diffusion facilitator family transporter [uncultured Desulfovibrio sp.]